jgi:hypothetical protein
MGYCQWLDLYWGNGLWSGRYKALLEKYHMTDCNPVQTASPQGFEALPATDNEPKFSQDLP